MGRPTLMIDRPRLTIMVTPQPSVLDRLADHREFRGRGLLGRFAFVMPTSRVGQRKYQSTASINEETRDAYTEAIKSMFDGKAEELALEGAACEEWAGFANELEAAQADGQRLAHVRDWASKHAGRVARIAGLLHLAKRMSTDDRTIAVETVTEAWSLGQWLIEHALAAFGRMTSDPATRQAKWILAWIRRHGLQTFTLRTLADHKRDVDKPGDFLPALEILEARHYIRRAPAEPTPGKRGRKPSPTFNVNPQAYAEKSGNSENSDATAGEGRLPELHELLEAGAAS